LGEVRAKPSKDDNAAEIEAAIRQEAAKLGADAAFVVEDKMQVTGGEISGPPSSQSIDYLERRVVVAAAIKYQ
jgi:hypothetical protein